jgi:CO/xanthine dehydrogenase FAD-binding subunit
VRLTDVEEAAAGRQLDDALVTDLVGLARDSIDPAADGAGSAEYRKHLIGTLLARSLRPQPGLVAA